MEMDKGTVEKVQNTATSINDRIQEIKDTVDGFNVKLEGYIQAAQNAILNNEKLSQKGIDNKLQTLQTKYDKFWSSAQEWVDDQVASLNQWIEDTKKGIQEDLKRAEAQKQVQTREASTGETMPPEAVDEIAANLPDPPIPFPSAPSITIPKPEFPFPSIQA